MEALTLPLLPGSTTAALHPINVLSASWAVLQHALRSLHPDTAIVRRTHRPHRSARSQAADTASVGSSRGSHVSSAATAAGAAPESIASGTHRRHRTHSGDHDGSRRRRHHSTTQDGDTAASSAPSASRRTRSAEEPLAAARRTASEEAEGGEAPLPRVRRSHSDGVRGRTRRHGSGESDDKGNKNTSGATTPTPSTSRPLSPAAVPPMTTTTPPLAPPPPVTRGLGKPPLSTRHRTPSSSTPVEGDAAAPASASRQRHHRSGSGSGGGLSSSGRSSRSRRAAEEAAEGSEASVIVIRDGTGVSLGSVAAGWSFLASPATWWRRVRAAKVTRAAFVLHHVLHAVPVVAVHYCCELKRQLVTLPLLRFSDTCMKLSSRDRTGGKEGQQRHVAHSDTTMPAAASSSTHHDTRMITEWPPTEEAFARAAPSTVGQILFTRWMLQAAESYVEKLVFLDETLVVRQLRSRRTLRRVVGWSLRLVSHTVLDPFLLSIVVPMLLSSSDASAAASDAPRVLFTVPGVARGVAMSAASVAIQWLVMPIASRLVYRAALTVFEVIEYLVMRRYAHWSDEEDEEDEYDESDDDEEGEENVDDAASLASGVSATASAAASANGASRGNSRSASQQSSGGGTGEDRIRRERRRLKRERAERRARRAQRQAARDQAMRRTIVRAIVYRVVSTVVAQSVVDHPLSVLVELLRGRATLHYLGMLTPYAAMTPAADGLSWANVWRYADAFVTPGSFLSGAEAEEEAAVPPVVLALRRLGRDTAHELMVVSSSVLDASGQREALAGVERRAAEKRARGEITSAADSADFLLHSFLSLSPFYYGLQFTVLDKVLTFYLAVWTRLTRQ